MTFPPLSIWGFPKIGVPHFIIHFDGIFPKNHPAHRDGPGQLAMIFRHLCGGGRHRGGGGGRRHRGG